MDLWEGKRIEQLNKEERHSKQTNPSDKQHRGKPWEHSQDHNRAKTWQTNKIRNDNDPVEKGPKAEAKTCELKWEITWMKDKELNWAIS